MKQIKSIKYLQKLIIVGFVLLVGSADSLIAQTFSPSADTYIRGGSFSDVNYGTDVLLYVKQGTNDEFNKKAILKFNLQSLGLDTLNIDEAILRIYLEEGEPCTVAAFECSNNWTETALTWSNAPLLGAKITETAISAGGAYYEWDITSYLQTQAYVDGIVSVSLYDEQASTVNNKFSSREAAGNHPELIISTSKMTAPLAPSSLIANAISNKSIMLGWTDNASNETGFIIERKEAGGSFVKITDIEANITTYYDSTLAENTTYVYQISAFNSLDTSVYSNEATATTTDSPTPLDYYVDAINGDDSNNGMSADDAWQSLDKVNATTFVAGNRILFKSGDSWVGQLILYGSGSYESPITIGKYGSSTNPVIHGTGSGATIHLNNQEYITIRDLEITNYNADEQAGTSMKTWETENITNWFEHSNPPQLEEAEKEFKYGVLISAEDIGEVNSIHLINLEIHGINGAIDHNVSSTKNNGGVYIEVTGSSIPTYFDDLLIDSCYIHDVDRTGLSNRSSWSDVSLPREESDNWTPNTNFVVSNCRFERAGANALIVRVAQDPMMEYNIFYSNGIKSSGNAAFNFGTDGAVWQFNESSYTKANIGDADAGGIDSDYRSTNTTIQYNYLHDNDFGMLITGGRSSVSGFNNLTILRYNIFEHDGHKADSKGNKYFIRISGKATNTYIHNNVFYASPDQEGIQLAYHKDWDGLPINTFYYNNIYYTEATGSGYNFGFSLNNTVSHQIYYGENYSWPNSTNSQVIDPLFNATGVGPQGYQIAQNSPAVENGTTIDAAPLPAIDYFGNAIPVGTIDIGAHENSEPETSTSAELSYQDQIRIYPNPLSANELTIDLDEIIGSESVVVKIYNGNGHLVHQSGYNNKKLIKIDREIFSENSICFISVQTNKTIVNRKLVVN